MSSWMTRQLISISFLPLMLASCSSAPPVEQTSQTPTSPAVNQATDEERLATFKRVIAELKETKNPPVDEDYNVVTGADTQAFSNRESGAAVAYPTASSSTYSSTGSTTTNYASQAPSGVSYTSSADQAGVGALYATKASLQSHDYAGAARNSQACLDAAIRTGDPEAIRGAQALRDAVTRTTGY